MMNRKHTFPNLLNTVSFSRTHREALGEPLEDPERNSVFELHFRAHLPSGVGQRLETRWLS